MNNLTPQMQERLDKWKQHILPVKSAEKLRRPTTPYTSYDELERELWEYEKKRYEESYKERK